MIILHPLLQDLVPKEPNELVRTSVKCSPHQASQTLNCSGERGGTLFNIALNILITLCEITHFIGSYRECIRDRGFVYLFHNDKNSFVVGLLRATYRYRNNMGFFSFFLCRYFLGLLHGNGKSLLFGQYLRKRYHEYRTSRRGGSDIWRR